MRLTLFVLLTCLVGILINASPQSGGSMDWYDEAWAKVDSLDEQGLPKSALEVVETIYSRARRDANHPHLIKALLYQSRYRLVLEEDEVDKIFGSLEENLQVVSGPGRAVLESVIGELYWQYFQQNRYQFYNRTAGGAPDDASIETWDSQKIVAEALQHYRRSLSDPDALGAIAVQQFDPVVNLGSDSRDLRPTLYDFLAHRALDVLEHGESALSRPVQSFRIDADRDLAPAESFVAEDFSGADSLSIEAEALRIHQSLLRLHEADADPAALVHADLRRLAYVRSQLSADLVRDKYLAALDALATVVRDSPPYTQVRYQYASEISDRGNGYDPNVSREYKWDRKLAFDICEAAVAAFPRSRGAADCASLQTRLVQKELNVEANGVVLPDEPSLLRVEFRNVPQVFVRIVRLSRDEVRDWNVSSSRDEARLESLVARDAVYADVIALPVDGDLQSHATLIGLPAVPMGQYAVFVGSAEDFSVDGEVRFAGTLIASRLSYLERRQPDGCNRLLTLDRKSGHPLEGVKVTGYRRDNRGRLRPASRGTDTSDADGSVELCSGDNRYDNVELTLGNDWVFSTSGLFPNRSYNRDDEYPESRYFTDRAIYRPGQTVYFKGILLTRTGDHYEIRPDAKTTVYFRDVNRREIGSLELVSNEFGTVAGEFVAPRGVLTGNMTIEDSNGSTSFSVEEYKRPRFEVSFHPVTDAVALGDSIEITGTAESLAGAAIGDATVQYRVTRSTYFPWWGYRRWRPWPRSESAEIAYGTLSTEADGTFAFKFVAEDDPSISADTRPSYTYSITVDVTDIAGETRSAATSVSAATESIFLSLGVSEQVDADAVITFNAGAQNVNGQPLPFTGDLTVTRLEKPGLLLSTNLGRVDTLTLSRQEFKRIAPHAAYGDEEDPTTWRRGKVVFRRSISGEGVETINTEGRVNWEPGSYEVRLTTTKENGEKLEAIRYTTVFASRDDDAPDETLDWFTLLTPSVQPGDEVRYLLGTTERDIQMLVELEKDGSVIDSKWVRVSREQKQLSFPVLEEYRGNVALHVTFAWDNHVFTRSQVVNVPWTNKQLRLSWETFRSKLYPGQDETWKLKIAGPKGEAVAAELVASLYDASLDALRPHNWYLNLWPTRGIALSWNDSEFNRHVSFRQDSRSWNENYGYRSESFDNLNWFGFNWYSNRYRQDVFYKNVGAAVPADALVENAVRESDATEVVQYERSLAQTPAAPAEQPATVRKNLNETAFFFPQLQTDEDGSTILSFTIPEALTRWRFLGLAITKDLKTGSRIDETVTQKELMVTPNAPRFFREGDTIVFTGKVDNLTESDLSGTATIEFEDAETGETVTGALGVLNPDISITIKAGQSTPVSWELAIPPGISALTYRVTARTDKFSDGEEAIIPVLTNRMLVTESLPLPMRGPGTKSFRFDKLADNTSATLTTERLTLEYSPNPIWYAVQALPYLMEFPHECAEQVFSRFYANGIATFIVDQQPKLRSVYDSWKETGSDALLSNLEKNQELKSALLEEAPWVLQAKDETERKHRIGVLFDAFRMRGELVGAVTKLEQMQRPNGAWPWFEGMQDNRYITQHIVKGIGYLRKIGVLELIDDGRPLDQAHRAINYLDQQLMQDYKSLLDHKVNLEEYRPGLLQLHHLYARSFFPEQPMSDEYRKVHDYFARQARKYWLGYSYHGQGMIALEANRSDGAAVAARIVKSLRENSIDNEELGMYWKMDRGYYWYQAPIETQALLIEVFNEVAGDADAVAAMQLWLLKQKQTQDWKTTKATTDAIYALLMRGANLLEVEGTVSIDVGGQTVSSATADPEAGTGYIKRSWPADSVSSAMANVTVTKSGAGPAWGAVYWQYFEDLDQITPAETPLKLEKELYVQRQTDAGPTLTRLTEEVHLVPGDLVKVRVVVKVDRDMEYVHLKDMRSSGFEPVNVLSGFRWQDGLGYYESTRDAATHFFIAYLPKGTFVFEYPVRVSHRGDFSNGITSIQSMYAPEFASHSAGVRVKVGGE